MRHRQCFGQGFPAGDSQSPAAAGPDGEHGLVARERLRGFPVRTRYRITAAGRAVRPLPVEPCLAGLAIDAARKDAEPPG
ncbi:hypothetical protein IQ279_09805 [Streptomyces verrucosisporus]|uniref:hypothetical protein n=1 Tax=Streptomyces verrucosisporus TaxID=1695161 RepID=UPI001F124125|nr:hypothetical protein [Streptomyces verrucosisporus]MBN3929931.1 hypothetical protein [Streptomyces verrucosisporus]